MQLFAHSVAASQFCCVVVVVCLVAGCDPGVNSAKVRGLVSVDERLLSSGTVTFHPVSPGPVAYGDIQRDGSYTIHVGRGRSQKGGLPPGAYAITISSSMPPVDGLGDRGGPPVPGETLVPPRYRSATTTPFHQDVVAGPQQIDLELAWTTQDRELVRDRDVLRPDRPLPRPPADGNGGAADSGAAANRPGGNGGEQSQARSSGEAGSGAAPIVPTLRILGSMVDRSRGSYARAWGRQ